TRADAPALRRKHRRGPCRFARMAPPTHFMETVMQAIRIAAALVLIVSGAASAADLTVRIDDVKSAQGNIMVALYDSADSFLKRPARATRLAAAAGAMELVIKDLPAGE